MTPSLRLIPVFYLTAQMLCGGAPVGNLWQTRLPSWPTGCSPALAPDGTTYAGTFGGQLVAVSSGGAIKWVFQAGREIKSSPAIGPDGTIYFGSRDWKLYALTPQGALKWAFRTGLWVDSSPAIGAHGAIYFGSWDHFLYALDPEGRLKWKFATGGVIDSSPAIGANGTIYFGSHDHDFYAVSPAGKPAWKFQTGGAISSSPAIGPGGRIYFASTDGFLYALHPDGTEIWRLRTGGIFGTSPILDDKGRIYIEANQLLIAVSPEGKKLWDFGAPWWVHSSPAAAANGTVYCPYPWQELLDFGPDRTIEWTAIEKGGINGSPVIGPDGTVYFTCADFMTAYAPSNAAPPANSTWPMFRADARHTGRVQHSPAGSTHS
ncbi:MAG: PQQ-binding-like beta-propeller repeat protein [Verrucomicrobia bacterium]|nr:PQQ-binding-like beta-propeller repeat protein [Verrucomicrobiota bacterium]MDE3099657.1 PQQ-like beta-propeller repeat protein [Verrucomicrobiota bacterium]